MSGFMESESWGWKWQSVSKQLSSDKSYVDQSLRTNDPDLHMNITISSG